LQQLRGFQLQFVRRLRKVPGDPGGRPLADPLPAFPIHLAEEIFL